MTLYPVALALTLVSFLGCQGCGAATPLPATPRERARAVVLVLAEGTKVADHQCAEQGKAAGNLPLLEKCAAAYSVARSSLLVAAGSIDAFEAGRANETACATQEGIGAAEDLAGLVRFGAGGVPPALVDALALASQFSMKCVRSAQKDAGNQ